MKQAVNIFWFRRDLRLDDNKGFYEALKGNLPVLPIFIFDKDILKKLPEEDARVSFIFNMLQDIRLELINKYQSSIALHYGNPLEVYRQLVDKYDIKAIYTNQ